MAQDRLHPLQRQLRHRGAARRAPPRARPRRRAHPASEGYACEKAQRLDYYQNGRDRLTTPLRRRADGTFEPIDWDTAIREIAAQLRRDPRHPRRRRRSSITAAAGRGTTSAAPTAGATRGALGSIYTSNALAQEKTGEFWVDGQLFGRPRCHTDRRLRARRGRGVRRQEPVAVARLPARARRPARDRGGSRARARSSSIRAAPRPPSSPTSTSRCARAPTPSASARCSPCWSRRTSSTTTFLRERTSNGDAVLRGAARRSRSPTTARAPGVAEALVREVARRIARAGERVDLRGPRHPAGAAQHAQLVPREAHLPAHRQLREAAAR